VEIAARLRCIKMDQVEDECASVKASARSLSGAVKVQSCPRRRNRGHDDGPSYAILHMSVEKNVILHVFLSVETPSLSNHTRAHVILSMIYPLPLSSTRYRTFSILLCYTVYTPCVSIAGPRVFNLGHDQIACANFGQFVHGDRDVLPEDHSLNRDPSILF